MTGAVGRIRTGVWSVAVRSDPPWIAAGVFVGYLVGSEAAFRFAAATDLQAVFFIPAGITLAALVRLPRSSWWIVLAAAAVAEFAQDVRAGLSVGQSTGFVLANTVEPVVGASIIAVGVRRRLDLARLLDVRWFFAGGVLAGPAAGAAIGALADRAIGGDSLMLTFWQWWLGDGLGVLLIGGLLLALGSSPDRRPVWSRSGAVLVVGAVGLTVTVLAGSDLPLMFIVLTGLVVAGARFGVRAVTAISVVVAITAAFVFLADGDIMVGVSDATGLVVIKLNFVVFTLGGMVVAAEAYERDLLTLEHARLQVAAAEEHRLVDRFQRLSLPPEVVSGRHFVARGRYLAASSGLGIGGDWYDVVELPDGRVYVGIGDVVGHGAEAAATMSQLKVAMSLLAHDARSPAELLARADSAASSIPGAFCSTAWVGYFHPTDGTLTFASAGHPPAFLARGHTLERLDRPVAAPIGVQHGGPKPESSVSINDPARLFLYTDGLIERRGGSVDDALDHVARLIGPSGGSENVLDALEQFAGDADDTVLLEVALRPATGRLG